MRVVCKKERERKIKTKNQKKNLETAIVFNDSLGELDFLAFTD